MPTLNSQEFNQLLNYLRTRPQDYDSVLQAHQDMDYAFTPEQGGALEAIRPGHIEEKWQSEYAQCERDPSEVTDLLILVSSPWISVISMYILRQKNRA